MFLLLEIFELWRSNLAKMQVLSFQVQKSFHQLMLTLAIYDFIYVAISMVLFGLPAIDERYICGVM
jgi:hypothetical protein